MGIFNPHFLFLLYDLVNPSYPFRMVLYIISVTRYRNLSRKGQSKMTMHISSIKGIKKVSAAKKDYSFKEFDKIMRRSPAQEKIYNSKQR